MKKEGQETRAGGRCKVAAQVAQPAPHAAESLGDDQAQQAGVTGVLTWGR